jgi:hypothetical protein
MARSRLGMLALVAASACGQIERDPLGPMTMGGADTGGAGTSSVNTSDAGIGGVGSSGLAGTGGFSHVQSAVAECQHYCETLYYQLPHALCEDWNRPEWDPQFCRPVGPTNSCADSCTEVYEDVTPECAARLQPAIRCVAPTYANVSLPAPSACWLGDCRAQLFSMTSACYGLKERLAAARATWEASRVTDYQLTYYRSGDARGQVVVRSGSEPVVTPADAFAWTVPKLFDEVERTLQEPGVAPSVSYDANLGYVVDLAREEGCAGATPQVTGVEVAPFR